MNRLDFVVAVGGEVVVVVVLVCSKRDLFDCNNKNK
jgi:hypothetical protein